MLSKNEITALGIVAGATGSVATRSPIPFLIVAAMAYLFWRD
jgi:hypothetical protein